MAIWREILRHAAAGDGTRARTMLANDLRLALCEPVYGNKTFEYRGPLPKAVASFISSLPESERSLARSYADYFTDHILDEVVAGVERTLLLVEALLERKVNVLDEIVSILPWPQGLKLGEEWKRQRVANELRSMVQLGIPLPDHAINLVLNQGQPVYEFNEIAFATAPRRLVLSWKTFKRQQEVDDRFICVDEVEGDSITAAEAFDYGSIARALLRAAPSGESELKTDLRRLGSILGPRLSETLDTMHNAKPSDGYRPIAWHNVFWNLCSEYEGLQLALKMLNPFCPTDQKLADWVGDNYREVIGTSRPVILRRRKALHEVCEEQIHRAFYEKFTSGEQSSAQITHSEEG